MKKISVLFVLLMSFSFVQAQTKKSGGSSSYNAGIGVHLGEPFAVSYKKNMGKRAWEASIGITRRSWAYDDYTYLDSRPRFNDYFIEGSNFGICTSVQFHYLLQYDLKALEGLKLYWGLGPQLRFRPYSVNLRSRSILFERSSASGIDLDLGIDGVFGAEYKFKKIPLAVFADIVPFTEFVDRFYVYPMGGIGARFTF
jgi:hypothetical protein